MPFPVLYSAPLQDADAVDSASTKVKQGIQYVDLVHNIQEVLNKNSNIDKMNMPTLRTLAPNLKKILYFSPDQLSAKDKIKGLWKERPEDWPVDLAHVDPNNAIKGKRARQDEVRPMVKFMLDQYHDKLEEINAKSKAAQLECHAEVDEDAGSTPPSPTVASAQQHMVTLMRKINTFFPDAKAALSDYYQRFFVQTDKLLEAQPCCSSHLEQMQSAALQAMQYIIEQHRLKQAPPSLQHIHDIFNNLNDLVEGEQSISSIESGSCCQLLQESEIPETMYEETVCCDEEEEGAVNIHDVPLWSGPVQLHQQAECENMEKIKQSICHDHDYSKKLENIVCQNVDVGQLLENALLPVQMPDTGEMTPIEQETCRAPGDYIDQNYVNEVLNEFSKNGDMMESLCSNLNLSDNMDDTSGAVAPVCSIQNDETRMLQDLDTNQMLMVNQDVTLSQAQGLQTHAFVPVSSLSWQPLGVVGSNGQQLHIPIMNAGYDVVNLNNRSEYSASVQQNVLEDDNLLQLLHEMQQPPIDRPIQQVDRLPSMEEFLSHGLKAYSDPMVSSTNQASHNIQQQMYSSLIQADLNVDAMQQRIAPIPSFISSYDEPMDQS